MNRYAQSAVKAIKEFVPDFTPKVGIVLGSGLGAFTESINDVKTIDYVDIDGFPRCTVEGHSGQLYLGTIHDVKVACLSGRSHYYEGYSLFNPDAPIDQLIAPVRTLKLLGCNIFIATNSVGSMRTEMPAGSLVVISDHINFQANNPLVGSHDRSLNNRFINMENAYDIDFRRQLTQVGQQLNLPIAEGVYIGVLGPSFETPAEIRAFRQWGADVVGMSTVAEVITARHDEMRVAVISAVTNMAAGMSSEAISHDLTLRGAKNAATHLIKLLLGFLKQL